jgi:hypothetical protein
MPKVGPFSEEVKRLIGPDVGVSGQSLRAGSSGVTSGRLRSSRTSSRTSSPVWQWKP